MLNKYKQTRTQKQLRFNLYNYLFAFSSNAPFSLLDIRRAFDHSDATSCNLSLQLNDDNCKVLTCHLCLAQLTKNTDDT